MREPQSFVARLPEGSPTEDLGRVIATGFQIAANFEAKGKSVRSDPALSEAGKRQQIAALRNGSGFTEHLGQLRKSIKDGLAEFREDRAKIRPVAPDKTDLAGEMRRGEIRSYLRTLPVAERLRWRNPWIAKLSRRSSTRPLYCLGCRQEGSAGSSWGALGKVEHA